MKHKHFYSHLIKTTDITVELGDMELSAEERVHLVSLVDANIHSSVMSTVLSNLSEQDKKAFLKNILSEEHEKTWTHLKQNIDNAEEKIKNSIEEIIKELSEDIKKAKMTTKKT